MTKSVLFQVLVVLARFEPVMENQDAGEMTGRKSAAFETAFIVAFFGGGMMVSASSALILTAAWSVNWITKLDVPVASGMPLIVPSEVSLNPAGSAPAVSDQL